MDKTFGHFPKALLRSQVAILRFFEQKKQKTAQILDDVMGKMEKVFKKMGQDPEFKEILDLIKSADLDEEIVSLGLSLQLFDQKREALLDLYSTGTQVYADGDAIVNLLLYKIRVVGLLYCPDEDSSCFSVR